MMKQILLIGAGRSSTYLIEYLLEQSTKFPFLLKIADYCISENLKQKANHTNLELFQLKQQDNTQQGILIAQADLVISLVPAVFHYEIALKCLELGKNLVTASYISKQMQDLDSQVKTKGLLFLNEMGLDPGIDHLSTMELLDELKQQNATIISYKSHCGGLTDQSAPTNAWKYKFSWNPTNVVLAGQGDPSKFLQDNTTKYIPYNLLFKRSEPFVNNPIGDFEFYLNRDSCKYQTIYGLQDVQNMQRTTIRPLGFCKAWSVLVDLGLTDNEYFLENTQDLTYGQWINSYLKNSSLNNKRTSIEQTIGQSIDENSWEKIQSLGIFNNINKINLPRATSAQILEKILLETWSLKDNEKDIVIMQHQIKYRLENQLYQINSTMHIVGQDSIHTAMAKTVGLPLGIAALEILQKNINITGVCLPIDPQIYKPVLKKLAEFGIKFEKTITQVDF